MEKEKFEKIIRDLEVRATICEKRLEQLTSKEDLLALPLKDFIELKNFCQEEQGRMDKVNNDLYHLVGMGGLTPIQLQKFCGLIKRYLAFRSDVKYLASLTITDTNINFPAVSSYKTYLGQIKLETNPRKN
jgi:hypothetical protein